MSKLKQEKNGGYTFNCPGCKTTHTVGSGWNLYTKSNDVVSFQPSILVKSGHYASHYKEGDSCWCTHNAQMIAEGEDPSGFSCGVCHSFITDNKIQFLSDCTHELAGQTVELPDWID